MKLKLSVHKGENVGHPFRGNQFTDWQGRSIGSDRVIRGGNLTNDEVHIMDLAAGNPISSFKGKDVNKTALNTLIVNGFVKPLPKMAMSYDQYYKLTAKGMDLMDQLYRVRKRISAAEIEAARRGDALGMIDAAHDAAMDAQHDADRVEDRK